VRFRLAVYEPNWPFLTGGRCSDVVVKAGLTVLPFFHSNYEYNFTEKSVKII
jgi:hypothetical protein